MHSRKLTLVQVKEDLEPRVVLFFEDQYIEFSLHKGKTKLEIATILRAVARKLEKSVEESGEFK